MKDEADLHLTSRLTCVEMETYKKADALISTIPPKEFVLPTFRAADEAVWKGHIQSIS